LRILRVHGSKPKYYHAHIGGNFRIDEIQAAVLLIKLNYLDNWTEARQRNAEYYNKLIADSGFTKNVSTPVAIDGYRHIYNQYVLRVENRNELRKFLTDKKIGTEIYYPVPLHMQDCFSYLGYSDTDCANSLVAADSTIALPIYPELSNEQQQYVVEMIKEFYS